MRVRARAVHGPFRAVVPRPEHPRCDRRLYSSRGRSQHVCRRCRFEKRIRTDCSAKTAGDAKLECFATVERADQGELQMWLLTRWKNNDM